CHIKSAQAMEATIASSANPRRDFQKDSGLSCAGSDVDCIDVAAATSSSGAGVGAANRARKLALIRRASSTSACKSGYPAIRRSTSARSDSGRVPSKYASNCSANKSELDMAARHAGLWETSGVVNQWVRLAAVW